MLLPSLNGGLAANTRTLPELLRRLRLMHERAAAAVRPLWARCDRALRAWNARRIARELQEWPDERLRDIGLNRAEIVAAVEGRPQPFRWAPETQATIDPSRFGH